jgi:sulfatase maturation enzyme AslB (radical SAM superfamily)
MLNNERPLECAPCYDLEDRGIESKRNRVNKKYANEYDCIIGGVETMDISRLDINIGSTCNFKCRMCTGFSSSRLRAEEKHINTHGDIEYKVISQSDINNVMPEILHMVDTVDSIAFAGGESLLISEYNLILERLIKTNRTNVNISYSSNISILPKRAMKLWDSFSNINVTVSIDSIGEHAEYYRNGTKWDNIVKNYDELMSKNINVTIRSTLSIYNAFRLIQFQNEWISKKLIHPDDMSINVVEYPDYLSVQVLPLSYRNRLNSSIDAHIEFLNGYNSIMLIRQWERIQQFLTIDNSYKLNNFFEYTDKLDTHRLEKFELLHPEYINLRQHIGE